jgi:hypothetical protein
MKKPHAHMAESTESPQQRSASSLSFLRQVLRELFTLASPSIGTLFLSLRIHGLVVFDLLN